MYLFLPAVFDRAQQNLFLIVGPGAQYLFSQRQAAFERTSDGYREGTHVAVRFKTARLTAQCGYLTERDDSSRSSLSGEVCQQNIYLTIEPALG